MTSKFLKTFKEKPNNLRKHQNLLGGNKRDLARAKNIKKQQETSKSKGANDKSGVSYFFLSKTFLYWIFLGVELDFF